MQQDENEHQETIEMESLWIETDAGQSFMWLFFSFLSMRTNNEVHCFEMNFLLLKLEL